PPAPPLGSPRPSRAPPSYRTHRHAGGENARQCTAFHRFRTPGLDRDPARSFTEQSPGWGGARQAGPVPWGDRPARQTHSRTNLSMLTGILEWPQRAEGRVRQLSDTLVQSADDPVVPQRLAETMGLRHGQEITVQLAQQPAAGGRPRPGRPVVERVLAIEGLPPPDYAARKPFDQLTSIDPQPRLTLEYPGCPVSCRLIDLFCPIGRGQRALIVSPPKAGKTTLLKEIAAGIARNHPDVELFAMLIDERPEEVTEFRRSVPARVFASSNDHDVERHIAVATMVAERAKRMVEAGKHVLILLDSLTRLGRAFNASRRHANSGRTMSGGLDSRALVVPKQIFGCARNTEEGGSITVVASCLVDTGSQADQVIFEEFKGTGNMELILDRKIAERRIFPAINLAGSGTRKEHLLMPDAEYKTVTALRRRLMNMPGHQQAEQLLAAMARFKTNAELVAAAG
ncbi:MAG: transcription termination factor Rho, partial [Phycisphaerales bacterium]|nr:transcription termination factor Rho [Phycisphaerales bacterium]